MRSKIQQQKPRHKSCNRETSCQVRVRSGLRPIIIGGKEMMEPVVKIPMLGKKGMDARSEDNERIIVSHRRIMKS